MIIVSISKVLKGLTHLAEVKRWRGLRDQLMYERICETEKYHWFQGVQRVQYGD